MNKNSARWPASQVVSLRRAFPASRVDVALVSQGARENGDLGRKSVQTALVGKR